MGRPRVHDERTRTSLVAAAERLLQAGGPEAVTVRAVAAEAGTTVQAIYSVAGGKVGLMQSLHAEAFRCLLRTVRALPSTDDPVADLVRIGAEGFRSFCLDHPSLFRLAFERLAPEVAAGAEAEQAAAEAFGWLRSQVLRAGVPAARAEAASLQFHALCQGMATSELQGFLRPASVDPAALWREAFKTFLAGLVAKGNLAQRTPP